MNWYPTAAVAILLTGFTLSAHAQDEVAQSVVEMILMDGKTLAKTKIRIENKAPDLQPALAALILEADAALEGGPYSVTVSRRSEQNRPATSLRLPTPTPGKRGLRRLADDFLPPVRWSFTPSARYLDGLELPIFVRATEVC